MSNTRCDGTPMFGLYPRSAKPVDLCDVCSNAPRVAYFPDDFYCLRDNPPWRREGHVVVTGPHAHYRCDCGRTWVREMSDEDGHRRITHT